MRACLTIILVNLPRGEHKVLIEAVDPEGRVLAAQTVTFKSPGKCRPSTYLRKDQP